MLREFTRIELLCGFKICVKMTETEGRGHILPAHVHIKCVVSCKSERIRNSVFQHVKILSLPTDTSWVQEGGGDLEGVSNEMEEAALGVTREDIQTLKKNAPVVLNETLLKKILDINQVGIILFLHIPAVSFLFIPFPVLESTNTNSKITYIIKASVSLQ